MLKQAVLRHLKEYKSITSFEAFTEYGQQDFLQLYSHCEKPTSSPMNGLKEQTDLVKM